MMLRVAVDAGGTFTDVAVLDAGGQLWSYKVLSHAEDPALGMLRALDAHVPLPDVDSLVNGTTVGLNTILARKGTRVLLITTEGFGDVLALGRAERKDIWQLKHRPPTHLVDVDDVVTVAERVLFDGSVELPVDLGALDPIIQRIEDEGISSIAVCLLHAHANPANEIAIGSRIVERLPHVHVSLSHRVAPEIGEYERFSSTVMNAYIATSVGDYLARALGGLDARSYRQPLLVMRSSGGVTSAGGARARPLQTLLSGPAGGVVGTAVLARALGRANVLGIDMGGTSLDACVVIDGEASLASQLEIDHLPILVPVVDLITIGAGGGSIAWTQGGSLRVGPHSAGAHPGPACYGLGGTEPTVTDANLILGRLGHGSLADDAITLDVGAARRAFESLAHTLGMGVEAAAESVIAVTDSLMADALRTITVRRGHDPRDFALLAFGGAGPLHAVALADELGISEVLVPPAPGVFSAWGMLHAPVRHDLSEPMLARTLDIDPESLRRIHERLRLVAIDHLVEDGVDPAEARFVCGLDMRFAGQHFTVIVEAPEGSPMGTWDDEFRAVYSRTHGNVAGHAPTETVNVRLTAVGPSRPMHGEQVVEAAGSSARSEVTVIVRGSEKRAIVCGRDSLDEDLLPGPAIIRDSGATIYVPPGWSASAGPLGTVKLTKDQP